MLKASPEKCPQFVRSCSERHKHLAGKPNDAVRSAVDRLDLWCERNIFGPEPLQSHDTHNYATIGYGDLVLPKEWRLFGPLEGLTGILMCGLSTAFLFATLSRMYAGRTKTNKTDP